MWPYQIGLISGETRKHKLWLMPEDRKMWSQTWCKRSTHPTRGVGPTSKDPRREVEKFNGAENVTPIYGHALRVPRGRA